MFQRVHAVLRPVQTSRRSAAAAAWTCRPTTRGGMSARCDGWFVHTPADLSECGRAAWGPPQDCAESVISGEAMDSRLSGLSSQPLGSRRSIPLRSSLPTATVTVGLLEATSSASAR
jgi:hypothetical protein